MTVQSITVELPENLYLRLQNAARGMKQPVGEVLRRVVEVGIPPSWEEAPAAFQSDLAALHHLDDNSLWRIARGVQTDLDWEHYQNLLDKNAEGDMNASERSELDDLRSEADRFALRKAHAAALLRWRGRPAPLPNLSAALS